MLNLTLNSVRLYRKPNIEPETNGPCLSNGADAAAIVPIPTILMMHGWKSDLQSLVLLGDLLSAHFPIHLIDLPGFGKSPMHDGSWGTEEYADCIFEYTEANNLSNVVLLGHSFGARVAIRLGYKHPALSNALVLISAAGLQPLGWKRTKRNLKLSFNRLAGPKLVSRDYLDAGKLRVTLNKAVTENLAPLASVIKAPTLLLYGSEDTETPPEIGERYRVLFPNSTLIKMQGKDHFPFLGTGASLCAFHILKFLSVFENARLCGGK